MSSERACSGSGARPSLPARGLILLVEGYRVLLAPLVGGHCRFWPSCSVYAREALQKHGARRGTQLTLARLLRCQPFHRGGIDPVP